MSSARPNRLRPVGRNGGGGRLWGTSALVMAALHGGALALAVLWQVTTAQAPSPPPPPVALMIELPPAPPEKPPAARPEPPKPLERKPVDLPKPTPVKRAEAPKPRPAPKPAAPPPAAPSPTPAEVPLAPAMAAIAQDIAAPQAASSSPAAPPPAPSGDAAPTWQGALRAQLERFKQYPVAAQTRRQQGIAYVRFAMDRQGRVLWVKLERGSRREALDQEAVALVTRAQPLPPPPPEVPGDPIEIVAPVQFFLK